jgi:hypothetical protein
MWKICVLDNRFFDVMKFTSLALILLLFSCILSFPVAGLKISSYLFSCCSLLTNVSLDTWRIDWIHALIPHRNSIFYQQMLFSIEACMSRIILISHEWPLNTISDNLLLTIPVPLTADIIQSYTNTFESDLSLAFPFKKKNGYNRLMIQCHPDPIWLPTRHWNLTCISTILLLLFSVHLANNYFGLSESQVRFPFTVS